MLLFGKKLKIAFLKIKPSPAEQDKIVTIILAKTNGNRRIAAKKLGIGLRTLERYIAERIQKDK